MPLMCIYLAIMGCCMLVAWGLIQSPAVSASSQVIQNPLAVEGLLLVRHRKTRFARFLDRLAPWNERALHSRVGARVHQTLDRHLSMSRIPLNAMEFFVLKELAALAAAGGYVLVVGEPAAIEPTWLAGAVLGGFCLPDLWLRQRIQRRRHSIQRDMPELVDLLTLCVEAGSDFMNALNRVVREYQHCPLTEEFAAMLQEIRMGKRRREALRNLAKRLEIAEVSSLVRTLVQADRMGTGIGEALKVHAEDSRIRRFHQAERFVAKAPIKMLAPLLLIMGSVAGIVGAPILLRFLRGQFLPKF